MTNNTPSGAKTHRESTKLESHQTAKMFFFGVVQICVTPSWWFTHKTPPFLTEQCTSPLLFSRFEVTQGNSNCSLKNYGFHDNAIYLHLYSCAQIT